MAAPPGAGTWWCPVSAAKTDRDRAVDAAFGRSVKRLREACGLTRERLECRAGISRGLLSRIESGVNVSIGTLARFAEACGNRLQVQMVRETGAGYGKR